MGQMIDAVDPANIPAGFNGTLAVRITVLADPAGQVFDIEPGNAPAAGCVQAAATRLAQRKWSVLYVNESTEQAAIVAMRAAGLEWAPAALWPEPGVYEWATDPSGNIAAGRWRPVTTPLAVQRTFAGSYDLSETADNFPARVAGYIDGRESAWPAAAWDRFVTLPDAGWSPDPGPAPFHPAKDNMNSLVTDGTDQYVTDFLSEKRWVPDTVDGPTLLARFGQSAVIHLDPAFLDQIPTVGPVPHH